MNSLDAKERMGDLTTDCMIEAIESRGWRWGLECFGVGVLYCAEVHTESNRYSAPQRDSAASALKDAYQKAREHEVNP